MFTGNVVGTYLPAMVVYKLQKLYRGWTETPMVVYKVQNLYRGWTEGGSRNATYDVKKSGYFDGATFEKWFFKCFLQIAQSYAGTRARQIARTVTSVHATCTQKGFRMHKITCT